MKILVLVAFATCAFGAPNGIKFPIWSPNDLFQEDSKIIGGVITAPHEFPFVVSFQRRGLAGFVHTCGGTIYSPSWVIITAHCVNNIADIDNLRVDAGEDRFSATSGYEQVRGVVRIVQHPRFNDETRENDIALLQLSLPYDFGYPYNGTVSIAKLPTRVGEDYPSGTNVTVAGWGPIVSGGVTADKLRKVDQQTLSDAECEAAYGDSFVSTMICAASESDGINKGPCGGDLGSPLITDDGQVIGITSWWAQGCVAAGNPSVYTQVSYYIDWIQAIATEP